MHLRLASKCLCEALRLSSWKESWLQREQNVPSHHLSAQQCSINDSHLFVDVFSKARNKVSTETWMNNAYICKHNHPSTVPEKRNCKNSKYLIIQEKFYFSLEMLQWQENMQLCMLRKKFMDRIHSIYFCRHKLACRCTHPHLHTHPTGWLSPNSK